jgi:hypothetical protein
MFPAMPPQANKQERKLIKLFKSLDTSNQESFIAFGEFLQSRTDSINVDNSEEPIVIEPLDIPRPDEESVIKAIKRLSATYPMVDKENILHPISDLMTSHIISGRSAFDVIDDLQEVFFNEYKSLKDE